MKQKKAIKDLAVFVLQNKTDVITLVNGLELASLPYDAPISNLNEVVIDNSGNKDFIEGLQKIANEGYSNAICGGICIGILVAAIAITTGVAVQQEAARNKKMRDEIFKAGFRERYLTKEQLAEIAFINRKEMQKQFLVAQADYLQKEENMIQEQREGTRTNALYMVILGGVAVIIATKILNI
jgi:hypothetical protein